MSTYIYIYISTFETKARLVLAIANGTAANFVLYICTYTSIYKYTYMYINMYTYYTICIYLRHKGEVGARTVAKGTAARFVS